MAGFPAGAILERKLFGRALPERGVARQPGIQGVLIEICLKAGSEGSKAGVRDRSRAGPSAASFRRKGYRVSQDSGKEDFSRSTHGEVPALGPRKKHAAPRARSGG